MHGRGIQKNAQLGSMEKFITGEYRETQSRGRKE